MQVFGNCTHFHLQFFSSINLFCLFLVYFAAEAAHEGTELAIVVLLAREPPEEDQSGHYCTSTSLPGTGRHGYVPSMAHQGSLQHQLPL